MFYILFSFIASSNCILSFLWNLKLYAKMHTTCQKSTSLSTTITDPKHLTRMTSSKRYSNLPHLMDMFSILALPAQLLYQATQLELNKFKKLHKYVI